VRAALKAASHDHRRRWETGGQERREEFPAHIDLGARVREGGQDPIVAVAEMRSLGNAMRQAFQDASRDTMALKPRSVIESAIRPPSLIEFSSKLGQWQSAGSTRLPSVCAAPRH
jgi:hypothetical protein